MKRNSTKWMIGFLILAVVVSCFLAACNKPEQPSNETTGETEFVPETSPGAQLIAAGSLEAMLLKDGWKVRPDPNGVGKKSGWFKTLNPMGFDIEIPGVLTDVADNCSEAWFTTKFENKLEVSDDQRVWLELSGTGYLSTVYLNGIEVGSYKGAFGTYALDVTDAMKYDEPNVLYIYVCAPASNFKVDGIAGESLPTGYNIPRISGPVYLYVKPDVSIKDAYVHPSTEDGSISMTVTVLNSGTETATANLGAKVSENGKSMVNDRNLIPITAPVGESVHEISLSVPDFRYWDTDSPVLYNVTMSLSCGDRTDEFNVRTGFKDLRLDNEGYFTLNGERFFMKSTHTSLHIPGTLVTSHDVGKFYDMLLYLKSCGFNTVRYIRTAALPEIMQMCDEIGLIVYEEHHMSWLTVDCAKTPELFHESVSDVLYRDRNHVSLGVFGMLNETHATGNTKLIFTSAVQELESARKIAPHLFFMLSSGRWDGLLNLGSGSNPGSSKWDAYMGDEASNNSKVVDNMTWAWMPGMGDVHYYPYLPIGQTERETFEKMTKYKRAVFLSEAGMGSQSNIISEYLLFAQNDIPTGGNSYDCLKQQVEEYRAFYDAYGLSRIWATPEAVLEETEAYQTRQRALQLTMIRRVNGFNGYSMTMSHDAGFRGEGILEGGNYYKPGVTEMLQDGLDDLRFCITAKRTHLTAGNELHLEVVISDFDVLKDGQAYDVVLRITGPNGAVWNKQIQVKAGKDTVIKVTDTRISTEGWKSGKYTIGAEMLQGGHPTCGTATFYVTNTADIRRIDQTVTALGVPSSVVRQLEAYGATVQTYTNASSIKGGVLFVGDKTVSSAELEAIYEAAKAGVHVIFLSPNAIMSSGNPNVPFAAQGKLTHWDNWLYHYDNVVFDSPVMKGLQSSCIWDNEYYADIFSDDFYESMSQPTDTAVATFFAGIDGGSSRDFSSGFQLGTFAYGEGYITLNTLNLIGGSGSPVAQTIFSNLVHYEEDEDASMGPRYSGEKPEYAEIVNFNKGTIKLDGVIGENEWGIPFIKGMNAEGAGAAKDDLLTFSGDGTDYAYDMYMAYDDKYIYAAAVVRNLEGPAAKDAKSWASFGIMFARYEAGTTVPHIMYQGQEYEQYVHIRYHMLANGKVNSAVQNEGVDWIDQKPADYTAKYDEATKTLTFEVRIPVGQSNVKDLFGGAKIAVSAFVRAPLINGALENGTKLQYGNGITNPRGGGKTPMKNASGVLTLGNRI